MTEYYEFLVIQNDPNPNIPQEKQTCVKCNKRKTCVYVETENVCIDCYKGTLNSLMYCYNCNNLFEKENNRFCYTCNKITGDCCGALYFSRTNECVCKNCYNYICVICNKKTLSKEKQYIVDDEIGSIFSPICSGCRKNMEI